MYDITRPAPPYLVKRMAETAVWMFGISFGLGTILLLLQAVDDHKYEYYGIGFMYVIAATFINTIALCVLLIQAYIYAEYRKLLLVRAALLVANIPIAILYMYIVFKIL